MGYNIIVLCGGVAAVVIGIVGMGIGIGLQTRIPGGVKQVRIQRTGVSQNRSSLSVKVKVAVSTFRGIFYANRAIAHDAQAQVIDRIILQQVVDCLGKARVYLY